MGPYGFGWAVQWLMAFFYANDGLLASPRLIRLQVEMNFLMGLFDRVGLQTDIIKMVVIVCHPCYIFGGHSEVVYTQQMMGVGSYFRERQWEIFWCLERKLELVERFLAAHIQSHNRK